MSDNNKRKIRIMIVDDDFTVRKAFLDCVKDSHYEVVGEAADGLSAVETARVVHPDMAVLDIEMPNIDGLSVSKILLEEGMVYCTVMLTSFETDDYVKTAIENGAEGYITKPFFREQLLSVLDMSFAQSRERHVLQKDCANLRRKIEGKEVANRAKLIVMEQKGLDESEAYKYLRELSRRKNLSMENVAELILTEWENRKSE